MNSANLVMMTGQEALQSSLDVIANNIANANTTGFKRQGVTFSSVLEQTGSGQSPLQLVADSASYRDIANGPIKPTGNDLDLAISGSGYFEVQAPAGGIAYTRGGSFRLNKEGQMTTQSGEPVLGDGGQPIVIPDTASQVNVSDDGTITAHVGTGKDLSQLGKIALVKFDKEQQMQLVGNSLYTSNEAPQPANGVAGAGSIVQGAIEESNVKPIEEMTAMIQIQRNYQQAANLISSDHDRSLQALNTLAKTTV